MGQSNISGAGLVGSSFPDLDLVSGLCGDKRLAVGFVVTVHTKQRELKTCTATSSAHILQAF